MFGLDNINEEFDDLFRVRAEARAKVRELTAKAGEHATEGQQVPEELVNYY